MSTQMQLFVTYVCIPWYMHKIHPLLSEILRRRVGVSMVVMGVAVLTRAQWELVYTEALAFVFSVCIYSKISIIRTMIVRIFALIQSLMNVLFKMYGVHMWLVN